MIEFLININKNWLNYLNNLSHIGFIENNVLIFVDTPIFFLPIFLLGMWIYYTYNSNLLNKKKEKYKSNLIFIFYGILLATTITIIIQQFIHIERPEQYLGNTAKLLLKHIPDASFPSDHATVSFAFLSGLFFAGYKRTGYIFGIFVILMNLSRIIAGVHWPFDIIVGAIIGIIGSSLIFKLCLKNKFVNKLNLGIIKISSYIKL